VYNDQIGIVVDNFLPNSGLWSQEKRLALVFIARPSRDRNISPTALAAFRSPSVVARA
jgi:hypothetical protein